MKPSDDLVDAMARYWSALSSADAEAAVELISPTGPGIVVGTGPGERRDGPEAWRQGVRDTIAQLPGVRIEPGATPQAFAENGVGWLTDEPVWILPDGARIPTRVTTVWHQVDGTWRVVHLHLSVGVPDEKLGELIGS